MCDRSVSQFLCQNTLLPSQLVSWQSTCPLDKKEKHLYSCKSPPLLTTFQAFDLSWIQVAVKSWSENVRFAEIKDLY